MMIELLLFHLGSTCNHRFVICCDEPCLVLVMLACTLSNPVISLGYYRLRMMTRKEERN